MENKTRTILLVDDEDNIVRSLKRVFRREGYNILTANSGAAGLDVLAEHDVGVILSDQRMPQMNGTEFLKKAKVSTPESVRIVLSGYSDLESITEAINEGSIYKFLSKPWDDDLLRKNIREAFEVYELKIENYRLNQEVLETNKRLENANTELVKAAKEREHLIAVRTQALETTQELFEKIPVGLILVDSTHSVSIYNHKLLELLEVKPPGIVGMNAKEVLPEEVVKLFEAEVVEESIKIDIGGKSLSCFVSQMTDPVGLKGYFCIIR